MKFLFRFLIAFVCYSSLAQTYVFDTTFGNDGKKIFVNNPFIPKKALLINNNYYFISQNKIWKIDYNGQIVTAFGIDGFISLTGTNEIIEITDFVFENNLFYVYGKTTNTATNNSDIYIAKIDENGNFNSSFGSNGIVKIDFGLQESISDFTRESDGSLFCIGTRVNSNVYLSNRLIFFKIGLTGNIDFTFDPNGYKEYLENSSTDGFYITDYQNKKLLIGTTYITETNNSHPKILLLSVNSNGTINTIFGNNGSKTIDLGGGLFSSSINSVKLFNDKLYINYYYSASTNNGRSKFLIHDLTDVQPDTNTIFGNENFNFTVSNEGIFATDWCGRCCAFSVSCDNDKFNVSKRDLLGNIDTSFHTNGKYSYLFTYNLNPLSNQGSSQSRVFLKDINGKILVGGNVNSPYGDSGFTLIRIVQEGLSTNDIDKNILNTLYPNPFENKISFESNNLVKNIDVYDLIGRKIATPYYTFNNKTEVDLSSITEEGIYLIKILTEENKTIIYRIIKR